MAFMQKENKQLFVVGRISLFDAKVIWYMNALCPSFSSWYSQMTHLFHYKIAFGTVMERN